jgi:queuosine biosynthesis protein QueC
VVAHCPTANFFLNSWMPTLFQDSGLSIRQTALTMAMFYVGGIAGGITISRLLDKRGLAAIGASFLLGCPVVAAIGIPGLSHRLLSVAVFFAGFLGRGYDPMFDYLALTDDIAVPKEGAGEQAIPVTYVPARNTIFLAHALAWAEVIGARDIFIGVNAIDYSGYPDCRPEYIAAFENLANLATKAGVEGARLRVHAPLISLSKAEIIRRGLELGVDFSLTHSCYDPDSNGIACGQCDSCQLRLQGFRDAGVRDPIPYTGK